jgi:hypothetical protein
VGRDGRPILVLTNLDEDGNRIVDPDAPPEPPRPAEAPVPPAPLCEEHPVPAERSEPSPPPPPVLVTVVNAPVLAAPVLPVGWGSIVGGFRYPERQPFLGYGPGISSPGWFSGLGLNASNNFGHPPSVPTDRFHRRALPDSSR